jgi:hypothetical protein
MKIVLSSGARQLSNWFEKKHARVSGVESEFCACDGKLAARHVSAKAIPTGRKNRTGVSWALVAACIQYGRADAASKEARSEDMDRRPAQTATAALMCGCA